MHNFFLSCVWVGIEKGLSHASEDTALQKFAYNSKWVLNLKKLVRDKIVDHNQADTNAGILVKFDFKREKIEFSSEGSMGPRASCLHMASLA